MKSFIPRIALGLLVAAIVVPSVALAQAGVAVPNWSAPATYTPARSAITTMGDVTNPLPFVGVTPCRIVDTRLAPGPFGGPSIAGGTNRSFALPVGPCAGLPAAPRAYSLNITSTNAAGAGFFKIWPTGSSEPLVSTLNFNPGHDVANAAIVPAGTSGAITVKAGVSTSDLVIDINGYYGDTLGTPQNTFVLFNNSTAETMNLNNASTSCSSWCGIKAAVGSGWAIYGEDNGAGTAGRVGVYGQSNDGIGTYGNSSNYNGMWANSTNFDALAAFGGRDGGYLQGARNGVIGASTATTGQVSGVAGSSVSPDIHAAGVYGTNNQAAANAGFFQNTAISTFTYIGTQVSGVNYDLFGGARIQASSLQITGSPKNFVAPHPLDPSKEILYASVEAPTVDVYFRGTGVLSNGYAYIDVPDHFRFTAREGTYMTTLTSVGQPVSLSVESEGPEGIVVRGNGNTRFHYVVYAERAEVEGWEPVQKNVTFTPQAMEKIHLLESLPAPTKALLVKNGTLNPDGSYNKETARAMGWTIPERDTRESPLPR